MPDVKYTAVTVRIADGEGSFLIVGRVNQALTIAGYGDEASAFMDEVFARGLDPASVLAVARAWVNVR